MCDIVYLYAKYFDIIISMRMMRKRWNEIMKLSVIIPAYNEINSLPVVLPAVAALPFEKEIIVVDDGSSDGTREWLDGQLEKKTYECLKVIKHDVNRGKGAALITGFMEAQGRYVAVQDADMEYDPAQLEELMNPLEENQADAVFGSRMLAEKVDAYSSLYLRGNKFMTAWINFLFGSRYTDTYTCYKIFRTSDVRRMDLRSSGFEIEAEMSCKASFMGLKVMELPIIYKPRSREEGKKINYKDAIKGALKALILRISLKKDSLN